MNKREVVLSILRNLLVAVGSYLTGKFLFGVEIDDNIIGGWISAIVTLATVIWGMTDKTVGIEAVQSAFRGIIIIIGELAVGAGYINNEVMQSVLAIVTVVIPTIYSQTAKVKNINIATGKTPIADLAGVDTREISIHPKAA